MAENYIVKLKRENEELRAKLAEKTEKPNESVEIIEDDPDDYRKQEIEVVYGPNRQNLRFEKLTVQEAFDKLVEFYQQFELSTNRQMPRIVSDERGVAVEVNKTTVFARITLKDKIQRKEVTLIRDIPFWLAVDKVVLQDQNVKLISKKEWDSWIYEEEKKDLRADMKTRDIIRKEKIRKQMMEEEMQKIEKT